MKQRTGGIADGGRDAALCVVLQQADALRRPVRGKGVADDPVARDGAPEAAVVRRAAVVAHHEVVVLRDRDRRREVALRAAATGSDERLRLALAIADDVPVLDRERVAWAGDDALDEVHVGLPGGRLRTRLAGLAA